MNNYQIKNSNVVRKEPLVTKCLVFLVIIYAIIITIQKLSEIVAIENNFFEYIKKVDLVIFTVTTLLIILIIISLKKSLNKKYPKTKQIIGNAVIIWSCKIVINVINVIVTIFLSNNLAVYNGITLGLNVISLIFNITLLFFAVQFIIINKIEWLSLWIGLAIVQIVNFIYNLLVAPFIVLNNQENISLNLEVNFILMILKLMIIIIIVILYSRSKSKQ